MLLIRIEEPRLLRIVASKIPIGHAYIDSCAINGPTIVNLQLLRACAVAIFVAFIVALTLFGTVLVGASNFR